MVGDYVMTEHDCRGRGDAEDPVGLGAYTMDSHNMQRYVDAGRPRAQRGRRAGRRAGGPYPISYRSIVPKAASARTCSCRSACRRRTSRTARSAWSRCSWSWARRAGRPPCLAIDDKCDVQKVDYAKLRERLLADKQVLEWTRWREAGAAGATVEDAPRDRGGR